MCIIKRSSFCVPLTLSRRNEGEIKKKMKVSKLPEHLSLPFGFVLARPLFGVIQSAFLHLWSWPWNDWATVGPYLAYLNNRQALAGADSVAESWDTMELMKNQLLSRHPTSGVLDYVRSFLIPFRMQFLALSFESGYLGLSLSGVFG